MAKRNPKNQIIIYEDRVDVWLEGETLWMSQNQLVELFASSKANISEHIKNIFTEGELVENSVVRKFRTTGNDGKNYEVKHYNLDMVISLGYRVNSKTATRFRQWATTQLKEYIIKGYVLDSERLKNLGGGNYWKQLLNEIRDIRSSEKVLYRQVLDLYATAIDYDPKASESVMFFKIVQNKLHYAAHGHTAAEVIYLRVDSDKPFAGLTSFKGSNPTQAEAMIAKNYLSLNELQILNNLVSAYFDLAEINAIEEKPMKMQDYIDELDRILRSTGREVLEIAGKVSKKQAEEKAKKALKQYKAKNLSEAEKSYLESINNLGKNAKQQVNKNKG